MFTLYIDKAVYIWIIGSLQMPPKWGPHFGNAMVLLPKIRREVVTRCEWFWWWSWYIWFLNLLCLQIHIVSWVVPTASQRDTTTGKGGGNITDYRLREFHRPELCPVFQSAGHHFFQYQCQVWGPKPQACSGTLSNIIPSWGIHLKVRCNIIHTIEYKEANSMDNIISA